MFGVRFWLEPGGIKPHTPETDPERQAYHDQRAKSRVMPWTHRRHVRFEDCPACWEEFGREGVVAGHRVHSVTVDGLHLWECRFCGRRYLPSDGPASEVERKRCPARGD